MGSKIIDIAIAAKGVYSKLGEQSQCNMCVLSNFLIGIVDANNGGEQWSSVEEFALGRAC